MSHPIYLVTDGSKVVQGAYLDPADAVDHIIASAAKGEGYLTYSFGDDPRSKLHPYKMLIAYGNEIQEATDTELAIQTRLEEVGILR